jgi:hypothetical protein
VADVAVGLAAERHVEHGSVTMQRIASRNGPDFCTGSLWRMLPAASGQVVKAHTGDRGERRWAWRRALVGPAYVCPLAGVFGSGQP